MKKKMANNVKICGLAYEHDLILKETGPNSKNPGTSYISGTLSVATDEKCTNIVQVHYTYVTATTKNGGANNNYTVLKSFIDGMFKTVMNAGADNANVVQIDTSFDLNEFYNKDNEFVSVMRLEGGFIHNVNKAVYEELKHDPNNLNSFEVDMVTTSVQRKEANEERNVPECVILKGGIFNFRRDLLPVEFTVLAPAAMDYFESIEVSSKNPVFTKLRGRAISQVMVRKVEEEGAFGDAYVREVTTRRKLYEVCWAKNEPYEFDTPDTILASELGEAAQNREIKKAEIKKRADDWKKARGTVVTNNIGNGGYDF